MAETKQVCFRALCVVAFLMQITDAALASPCVPNAFSHHIVVDQFGYLPDGEKVAVIRDPQTGFDATASFTPGSSYALVNAANRRSRPVAIFSSGVPSVPPQY